MYSLFTTKIYVITFPFAPVTLQIKSSASVAQIVSESAEAS